jgi:hypothetical protein
MCRSLRSKSCRSISCLINRANFGFWILDFGFWILDFGFWILDFGFWIVFRFRTSPLVGETTLKSTT